MKREPPEEAALEARIDELGKQVLRWKDRAAKLQVEVRKAYAANDDNLGNGLDSDWDQLVKLINDGETTARFLQSELIRKRNRRHRQQQ